MNQRLLLILLCLTATLTCGFDWGFAGKDKCGDAREILEGIPSGSNAAERSRIETRAAELCPEGPAGHFVKARRFAESGKLESAMAEYREAERLDPGFTQASGNLGLLYLEKGMTDEAAVELTKAVKSSSAAPYHRGLGRIFAQRKIYSLAQYHFNEALKSAPDDPQLHADLADTQLQENDLDHAESEYQQALAINPAFEPARLGLAKVYLARKQTDKALDELKKAQNAHPQSKEVHRRLGEVYEQLGDKKSADYEFLLAGVAQNPQADQPLEYLKNGDAFLAEKNYDKAVAEYQKAIKIKPAWAEAQQKLGDALAASDKLDEAIAAYQAASRLKADDEGLHYKLGILYEKKGLLDEAVVEYRQSLKFAGEKGDTRQRLGDIYASRGSTPQAIEQYRELLKLRNEDVQLHLKLARLYGNAKDPKDAIAEYQEIIKINPDTLDAHHELALLYRKHGMGDEAEREFKEILRLKKDDVEARNALTTIYVKNKNYDDLITLLKENVELNPKDANSHYKLGLVYEFKKNYEDALASYKEAVALKDDHAKALNALGRVYMKTGHINEAKEALEAAKRADPSLEEPTVLLSNIRDELSPTTKKYTKKKGKTKKGKISKKGSKTKKKKKTTKSKSR